MRFTSTSQTFAFRYYFVISFEKETWPIVPNEQSLRRFLIIKHLNDQASLYTECMCSAVIKVVIGTGILVI